MSPSLRSLREESSYSPLWLLVPACVIASLLMAAASIVWLRAPARDAESGSPDGVSPVEQDPVIAAEIADDIRRFAVNAFVVPVIDEEGTPVRWQDPSLAVACQPGTQVHVNGRPIEPRSEVIGQEFSVLWLMEACLPFGAGGPELTGGAEVVGFRGRDGLSALVHLRHLQVRHRGQELVLDTSFVARTH
ncbi:MAG TPA: hypothetical protein VFO28_02135 [Burkholderiaceae bacterium]|nr:hypothetical protein [Burkholderiaceae bacterium]